MDLVALVSVGIAVGVTTVVFGFGGGFVTVPIISVVDAGLGADAVGVAAATSALVMCVNAGVATVSTDRSLLVALRGRAALFGLLALGGAVGAILGRLAPDPLLRWGFVVYIVVTVGDLVLRPGFLRAASRPRGPGDGHTIRTWLGLPIGAVAAFLGVGGSVMTVPMMRRAGFSLPAAATLANPLTWAIVSPAMLVALMAPNVAAGVGFIGGVDVRSAAAVMTGAMPTIVLLRRRSPAIPHAAHAWGYVALLAAAAVVVGWG